MAYADGTAIQGDAPSWAERVILLLTNEARCDPVATLKDCKNCAEKSCYKKPLPPTTWSHELARAARFHSTNLSSAKCFDHNSPCQLREDISTLYPDPCDGSVECACVGEVKCNAGTNTFKRISYFGQSGSGENIAMGNSDPKRSFMQWYWEKSESSTCGFSMENGHRYSILNPENVKVGVGVVGTMNTQDFGRGTAQSGFSSGIHYPNAAGMVEFKTHYYSAEQELKVAALNWEGECKSMKRSLGTKQNGVYSVSFDVQATCVPYYFQGISQDGSAIRYPAKGRLLFNCEDRIWEDETLATCDIEGGSATSGSGDACSYTPASSSKQNLALLVLAILATFALRRRRAMVK